MTPQAGGPPAKAVTARKAGKAKAATARAAASKVSPARSATKSAKAGGAGKATKRTAKQTANLVQAEDADAGSKRKRPDALRNRDKILRAAYVVFAEHGVDAQMTDIAEAAGVGVATLYRNFQAKEDLVNALLDEYFRRAVSVAEEAVQEPDAWEALVRFFKWVTSLQVEDRALSQFIAGRITGSRELREQRIALYEILATVAERAKEQGSLRSDVQVSDLRTILGAAAMVSSAGFPERVVRRLISVIVDGLRAPGMTSLEGPPVTTAELEAALHSMAGGAEEPTIRAFKRGRRPWPARAQTNYAG